MTGGSATVRTVVNTDDRHKILNLERDVRILETLTSIVIDEEDVEAPDRARAEASP